MPRSLVKIGSALADAARLVKPYFSSEDRRAARGLLAAIVALNLIVVYFNVVYTYWFKIAYNALQTKSATTFWASMFSYRFVRGFPYFVPGFCEIAARLIAASVYASTSAGSVFVARELVSGTRDLGRHGQASRRLRPRVQEAHTGAAGAALHFTPRADAVRADGLEVGLPDGKLLLKQDHLIMTPGDPIAVTGPSGSGKSTLLRALAGIWPFARGSIALPEQCVFLPQRPYMPHAT